MTRLYNMIDEYTTACTVFEEAADCESAKLNPPGGQMHL
jgi:hypothetical protein